MRSALSATATCELEIAAAREWRGLVAGVDEAGRGPWAGPVVAAAVILDMDRVPVGLADSKQLRPEVRAALFEEIVATSLVGVAIGEVARIDRDNILGATLWAMATAVGELPARPAVALVDGNQAPKLTCPAQTVVQGDALSASIAAASIVAKVTRDRLMVALADAFPGYGFDRHKGYGTPEHRLALARLGVTPHHRRSFQPIRELLAGVDVQTPGEAEFSMSGTAVAASPGLSQDCATDAGTPARSRGRQGVRSRGRD